MLAIKVRHAAVAWLLDFAAGVLQRNAGGDDAKAGVVGVVLKYFREALKSIEEVLGNLDAVLVVVQLDDDALDFESLDGGGTGG